MQMKLASAVRLQFFNFFYFFLQYDKNGLFDISYMSFYNVRGFFHAPVTGAILYHSFIPFVFVSLFYCLYFTEDVNANEHMTYTIIHKMNR